MRQAPRSVKFQTLGSLLNWMLLLLTNHDKEGGCQGLYHITLDVYFMIVLEFVRIGNVPAD